MNGEAITLSDDRENLPYQSLRRGEQHVAPGVSAAFTRPQVHVEHKSAFLHRSKAGSRPSG